jgi:hypothetical protein
MSIRRLAPAIAAIVGTATLGVWAQAGAGGGQQPGSAAGPRSQRFVAIGCVGLAGSQFTLTDSRGETPTLYRLDGDASRLKIHVGHLLEVAGTLTPGATTGSATARAPALKVATMIWIAKTCPKK